MKMDTTILLYISAIKEKVPRNIKMIKYMKSKGIKHATKFWFC